MLVKAFNDSKKYVEEYTFLIDQSPFAVPEGASPSAAAAASSSASAATSAGKRKQAPKTSKASAKAKETDRLAQVLSSLVDDSEGRCVFFFPFSLVFFLVR